MGGCASQPRCAAATERPARPAVLLGSVAPLAAAKDAGGGLKFQHARASRSQHNTAPSTVGRAPLVREGNQQLHDAYEVDSALLGEGVNGVVRKGTSRLSGAVLAVKAVRKTRVKNVEPFRQETEVMKIMDHPNIVKLFEVLEDKSHIYLVMEFCQGGELFDRIAKTGAVGEHDTADVMRQILRAVQYMHENNVVHRDLKPENFVFLNQLPVDQNLLKLIDFGLAFHGAPNTVHTDLVGTLEYAAPQVLTRKYDRRCDLWSCGAIMYVLLSGRSPFAGKSEEEVMRKVRSGCVSYTGSRWDLVSLEAKDLVRSLLKRNPIQRLTAEQAIRHPWLQQRAEAIPWDLGTDLVCRISEYRSQSYLTQAALQLVADRLPDDMIKNLRKAFSALDRSGTGKLSAEDLRVGLADRPDGEQVPDWEEVLAWASEAGDGISYTEFLAAALDRDQQLEESAYWQAFAAFHPDSDGRILEGDLLHIASPATSRTCSSCGSTRTGGSSELQGLRIKPTSDVAGYTRARSRATSSTKCQCSATDVCPVRLDFEEFLELVGRESSSGPRRMGHCANV